MAARKKEAGSRIDCLLCDDADPLQTFCYETDHAVRLKGRTLCLAVSGDVFAASSTYARNLTMEVCSSLDPAFLQVRSVFNDARFPRPAGCLPTGSSASDDSFMTSPLAMGVMVASLVVPPLLGCVFLYVRRRRAAAAAEGGVELPEPGKAGAV